MGRVAKYKKLKACDPFSSKNGGKQSMTGMWGFGDNGRKPKKRSKTSIALRKKRKKPLEMGNTFDVPPSGGDDFSLNDLTVKKVKSPETELLEDPSSSMTAQRKKVNAPLSNTNDDSGSDEDITKNEIARDPMLEEKRAARILKIEPEQRKKSVPKVERLAGESRKAFQKRVRSETRQILKNEKLEQRNPEKKQRKKEFLNKKKKRKLNQEQNDESDDEIVQRNESSPNDGFITGEQAVARATFGDQVERPPVFLQLPRGAKAKPVKSKRSEDVSEEAEQIAMENMRRKVQAQYAIVKAKRRKAGDFHL
jgi:hypothetical protein